MPTRRLKAVHQRLLEGGSGTEFQGRVSGTEFQGQCMFCDELSGIIAIVLTGQFAGGTRGQGIWLEAGR